MALYKNLLIDIFGGTKASAHGMLFEIHSALEELPPGSKEDAVRVLEKCLTELKGLN